MFLPVFRRSEDTVESDDIDSKAFVDVPKSEQKRNQVGFYKQTKLQELDGGNGDYSNQRETVPDIIYTYEEFSIILDRFNFAFFFLLNGTITIVFMVTIFTGGSF